VKCIQKGHRKIAHNGRCVTGTPLRDLRNYTLHVTRFTRLPAGWWIL